MMNQSNPRRSWRPWLIAGIVTVLLAGILFFIPVPYYVFQPGSALEVGPMVHVEKLSYREKGSFLLTTVAVREGNIYGYLAGQWNPEIELVPKKEVLGKGENSREYYERQEEVMKQSEENAVIAAFRTAGRPVKVKTMGVEVFRTLENMPAQGVLQKGDLIQRINGQQVQTAEELVKKLWDRKPGDQVRLTFLRKGKEKTRTLRLAMLNGEERGIKRAGIGVVPITKRKVETDPRVHVDAERIGGPSAGLMFTLEIMNQLQSEDITHGHRIAGTGTITPDGEVGQIGGVQHKIVAADKAGAEVFFVPADTHPFDQNEKLAIATVKRIGSSMKVVPVHDVKEAVRFLDSLSREKKAA
jgi:Lon-like protease